MSILSKSLFHFTLLEVIVFAEFSSPFICLQIIPRKRRRVTSIKVVAGSASKRTRFTLTTDMSSSEPAQSSGPPTLQPVNSQGFSESITLPPALLAEPVPKISDEVTRRLARNTQSYPIALSSGEDDLTEGPAFRGSPQGANLSTPVVQGPMGQLQDQHSGDSVSPTLPNTLFVSPSLPIDARASSKLRADSKNK